MEELRDALYRIGKVITSPKEAFDTHIAEKYSLSLPLVIYLAISYSLTSLVVKSIARPLGVIIPHNLDWLVGFIVGLSGVIGVAAALIDLLVYATLVHVVVRIMGYKGGKWDDFIGLVAYSSLPLVFPTALLALAFLYGSIVAIITSLILVALVVIWSLYLLVLATSVNYELGLGHAVLAAIVAPLIVLLIAGILISKLGALVGLIILIAGIVIIYLERR